MIEVYRNRGAKRPPLTVVETTAKVEAYLEWKKELDKPQREMLNYWEKKLMLNLRDCGDRSAAELMAEILLREGEARER